MPDEGDLVLQTRVGRRGDRWAMRGNSWKFAKTSEGEKGHRKNGLKSSLNP